MNFKTLNRVGVQINFSDHTPNYGMDGFCGIISILLNEILWKNIFVDDVFGFRKTNPPPSIDDVNGYISQLLGEFDNLLQNKKEKDYFEYFLCNYSYTINQKILLNDENKTLNEYKSDLTNPLDPHEPFIIVKLQDIISNASRPTVSTYVSVLIREYLLKSNIYLPYIGICLDKNKTVTLQQINALPLKDNGFYFYKSNLFYTEGVLLKTIQPQIKKQLGSNTCIFLMFLYPLWTIPP